MKYIKLKNLSDRQLWELVLTPIEDKMSENLKNYLKLAEKEFYSRDIKLTPIMDCSYCK